MFSRYYARDQVSRYQASPHKARIDHVASCLVARKYLDVVIADHVREWLRFTTYFDAHLCSAKTQSLPVQRGRRQCRSERGRVYDPQL